RVWKDVVRDFEEGRLQKIYRGHCSLAAAVEVQQFLLNGPVARVLGSLQAHRGCKFNCYFCAGNALAGNVCIQKPLDDFLALIRKVRAGRRYMAFLDNNIYADPEYARKLFRALKPMNMRWGADTSIDIAEDETTLRLLKESGCAGVLVGYEIRPGSSERKTGKFVFAKDYFMLTQRIKNAGIQIKGQFIFGFPEDSWVDLFRLWWFCFRIFPSATGLSFLTPLPGSAFFSDIVRREKLINLNWCAFDIFHQVWEHPKLGVSWLMRKSFFLISAFFLLTTSFVGCLALGCVGLIQFFYYHP
ncbi:MAG: hypothetical protein HQL19_04720, partial [Candidatus Omnitrophica bacterium]|nr:hypothetical protein [Candidatus Omnitrophota bacterium]